jgi:hypothetical protein
MNMIGLAGDDHFSLYIIQRFSGEMSKARELRLLAAMRASSLDRRERMVRAVDTGPSQREAARRCGVGVSAVKR